MIRISASDGEVRLWLISTFALPQADASLITEYAAAVGSHHIPGGEGRRLVYANGAWHVTRKDGTT
jgi:hypothetical protein